MKIIIPKLKTNLRFTKTILVGMSFALCFIQNSFAEESAGSKVIVSGIVKDKVTGSPLSGANVYVVELKRGMITDEDGKYLFKLPK